MTTHAIAAGEPTLSEVVRQNIAAEAARRRVEPTDYSHGAVVLAFPERVA